MIRISGQYSLIGWREWIVFPQFGDARVKAKVDTGARTSAIHATNIQPLEREGQAHVAFILYPNQDDDSGAVECEAPLVETRSITDSGGHEEERYVVSTDIELAGRRWPIELSLTDRNMMGFRMLLGRSAMRNRLIVRPDKSFLCG
jgi:hypothetical protein